MCIIIHAMCLKFTTCTINNQDKPAAFPLLGGQYRLGIASAISEIDKDWAEVEPADNAFLQIPYFRFLESNQPGGMSFRYLVYYKNHRPVGLVFCQLVELRIGDALSDPALPPFRQKVNAIILRIANMRSIFCGNILVTGDHGSYFLDSVDINTQSQLLKDGLEYLRKVIDQNEYKVSLVLIKDITTARKSALYPKLGNAYKEFSIQPNMVLHLRRDWTKFEDYLSAMSSKYRVRAKRAFKKGKNIEKKELNRELIRAFLPRIDELYKGIANKAGFNVVTLTGDYFLAFKEHFPDDFRVYGYFLKGELIAFYTTFKNYDELEAHYLGYKGITNHKYQVYLNMLYDIIRQGIDSKVRCINFARTALEIKSSVGATPVDLFFFGKHTNVVKNTLFTPILSYFNPKIEWKPRSPFKDLKPL